MAASLDGYIASATGDLAWLNDSMAADEDYRFSETQARTGAYIIGANSYREMASHLDGRGLGAPTYVVTHHPGSEKPEGVEFYSGDLSELVERTRAVTKRDIWVYGGADVVTQCLNQELLDELTVSVVPVLLGDGVRFFGPLDRMHRLRLSSCQHFEKSGIVLLRYTRPSEPTS
ncbi:MAG: dihydrofolate reductase family protein [Actinomycetota bacterium]|nr:dihydrofolate reductase family protein [Actinomycetota bacterium]